MFNLSTYLQRLNYNGPLNPSAETLRALHLAHLQAVPFENLDIILGRPILLDEAALYDKIVARRRGGFCYELNGLFAVLLRALGFPVTLLSARVVRVEGGFGPEFDHLALLIPLEKRWLADVGFGESFREPLCLDEPGEQVQPGGCYRLSHAAEGWIYWENGQAQYGFTLQPRRLADFTAMCQYHQTSPKSHFTSRRLCSLATPQGRVTFSDGLLILTANGQRQERQLSGQAEIEAALRDYFGVVLD